MSRQSLPQTAHLCANLRPSVQQGANGRIWVGPAASTLEARGSRARGAMLRQTKEDVAAQGLVPLKPGENLTVFSGSQQTHRATMVADCFWSYVESAELLVPCWARSSGLSADCPKIAPQRPRRPALLLTR